MSNKTYWDISDQQARLKKLIVRGNELLCVQGKGGLGYWGDTRKSSTSLWSICDCGLGEKHPHFLEYCLEKLLTSKEAIQIDNYLCFNNEVWDTSLALIAFVKGGGPDQSQTIEKIVNWLLDEAMDDNWDSEPWETLWAITALLSTGKSSKSITTIIKKCIKWVLDRRTADGILISIHYMAFLLSVLSEIVKHLKLTKKDNDYLHSAIRKSLSFIKDEYLRSKKQKILWENQP